MSDKESDPPGLAVWWLQHACPAKDNEALTGTSSRGFAKEKRTAGSIGKFSSPLPWVFWLRSGSIGRISTTRSPQRR
jgi:hypothetical protein